jgi:MFS family permease
VINGYTPIFGGFLLLGGRAGHLFGRRKLLLWGVAIFSFASLLNGLAMGLFFVPITLIATTNVGEEDAGLASGLFNTAQQVGGALGLGVPSTLAADKSTRILAERRLPIPAT